MSTSIWVKMTFDQAEPINMPFFVGNSAVGTVGIDSYSATADGPISVPSTPAGGTVLFDVLLNDTASGPKTLLSATAVPPIAQSSVSISGGQILLNKTGILAGTYFIDYVGALASNTAVQGAARLTLQFTTATTSYTAVNDGPIASLVGNGPVDIDVLANDTTVPAGSAKQILDYAAVAPLTNAQVSVSSEVLRIDKSGLAAGTYSVDYTGSLASNTAVRGTARATLTLTDGGGSSEFVRVYPMEDVNPGGKTVLRPSIVTNGENHFNIPANTIVSLRGRLNEQHKSTASGTAYVIDSGTGTSVICGGRSNSPNIRYSGTTDGASWASIHGDTSTGSGASGNYPAIRVTNSAAGFKLQGFYCKQTMDGFTPGRSNGDPLIVFENGCFTEIRDDAISNDGQENILFRNVYFQGHVWLSWRPGDPGPPGPEGGSPAPKNGNIAIFEHCFMDMDRMMWLGEDTQGKSGSKRVGKYVSPSNRNNGIIVNGAGMGHQHPIKTRAVNDSGGQTARVIIRNSVMRITTPPVDAYDNLVFPKLGDGVGPGSRTGSFYENFHVVWLGPTLTSTGGVGPWPWPQTKAQLAAMGITVHDGNVNENEAHTFWETHKAAWYAANGYNASSDTFSWNRVNG